MLATKMKIHETFREDGVLEEVHLHVDADGALAIAVAGEELSLPEGAVEAVMKRFGAALDDRERLTRVASLPLGHGRALQHVRHLGVYDVIARDYLVFTNGEDAVYAFATTVSGALTHLARAAAR